jgi:acetylornithine deacetylase/succinyl-diaminopimelate desuccinylase-like protein
MESIVAVRGKLPLNVMFVFEGEEELGSPHLPQFVARYADRLRAADGCLSPGAGQNLQGSVVLELGNKGIVYFEMEASGERMPHGLKKFDLSSYQQTVVESPVWRLVEALATLTDGNGPKLRIEELNRAVAPLTAQDRDLIRKLTRTFNPDEVWKRQFQVDSFTEGLEGEALLERYVFSPSLNIDGIWAGYTGEGVATLMPQKATAKLDLRLVPNLRASEVMPAIRRHLDERGFEDIALRELSGYDWSRTPLEAGIVETLLASYRGYRFEPSIWPLRPSGAPAYLFTGPPVSIPMIGGGLGHGARQHSVDEYLVIEGEGRIASLPQMEKFYADFLFALARG